MGGGKVFLHWLCGMLFLTCAACGAQSQSDAGPAAIIAAVPVAYEIMPIDFPPGFNGRMDCSLASLEKCSTTNALVWDEDFEEALRSFLGTRRRAQLDHPDGREGPDQTAWLVADSMISVLGGPPDDAARVGPYYQFSACRAHSCPEKGIAILKPEGEIVALGILHYWNEPGEVEDRRCCGHDPDLDIYYRPVADWDRLLPYLRNWGGA